MSDSIIIGKTSFNNVFVIKSIMMMRLEFIRVLRKFF